MMTIGPKSMREHLGIDVVSSVGSTVLSRSRDDTGVFSSEVAQAALDRRGADARQLAKDGTMSTVQVTVALEGMLWAATEKGRFPEPKDGTR